MLYNRKWYAVPYGLQRNQKEVTGMYYATIGALAILILLIENNDILFRRSKAMRQPVWTDYRRFLVSVLVYYITDVLWGIIESRKLAVMLYLDTTLYFLAMACGVLFWTQFVVSYLGEKNRYGRFLLYAGRIFVGTEMALICLNLFTPILFSVDAQCVYRANPFRYVMLSVQILLLILSALQAFLSIARGRAAARNRYLAIALFGIIMAVFLMIQLWHPYLPLYSAAYMLGTCLLHTFVVNNEKEEYKAELEQAVQREKEQYQELINARVLAYKDALTGVKTKLAYLEHEARWDSAIERKDAVFAIAVFDVNGLKEVNDTQGHEAGDRFIVTACRIICKQFQHSPVFRIGGDEFVAILEGEDYDNREALFSGFNRMMEEPAPGQPVIAMGATDFDAKHDRAFHDVFIRADKQMYDRKHVLKCTR